MHIVLQFGTNVLLSGTYVLIFGTRVLDFEVCVASGICSKQMRVPTDIAGTFVLGGILVVVVLAAVTFEVVVLLFFFLLVKVVLAVQAVVELVRGGL